MKYLGYVRHPCSVDRGHAKYVDGDNGQVQILQCNALGLHLKNRNNTSLAANAIRGSNLKYHPYLSSAVRPFRQILLQVLRVLVWVDRVD